MNSGSFASSYVETVRLPDPTSHNFRTLSVRNPRNSVTKYPLFLRNTLTPVPRNNAARYIQLLRSRSMWLLVSPGTDQMRSGQLRGGPTTTAEPTQQTSKDRSIGCPGAA